MGVGSGEWGVGNGDSGADSRQRIAETGEWGAVGRQQAAIWLGFAKMNVYNVYKRGCEKMVIIFSQPFFTYPISW